MNPYCERGQLFGANTISTHDLLLCTTGSLGDIEIIHLHSLIDMATVVAPGRLCLKHHLLFCSFIPQK